VHRRSIGTRGSYTDKPGIAVYLAIACPRWHNTGAIKQARRFGDPTRHPKRSSSRFGTQLSLYTVSTRSPRACGPVDVDPNGNDRRGYSMHVGHVGKFGKFAARKRRGIGIAATRYKEKPESLSLQCLSRWMELASSSSIARPLSISGQTRSMRARCLVGHCTDFY
jgi:hypothetical protein